MSNDQAAAEPPGPFAMELYLKGLKATEVRALADGMPYRHECTKNEIIRWLIEHQGYPGGAVARAMSEAKRS